ncbi:class I SAM-dependent methyltransferase [Pseudofulvibacter geojedonensis]|uniref:Class I SAM-dependent methyltransferase n=1 Tax=Pseudofulvibacter geojedonensis TaxID=1123758 RepID=A0ABW3I2G5_9FLAO
MEQKVKEENNWFASWFNTPYYHILYKDRDEHEAELFMKHLTNYLNLPENGSILDLACGKGRHAIYLNSLNYNVTGVDLSEQSIAHAKQFENDTLTFNVHDMRKKYHKTFDAVFNLFTSFGYFENDSDNLKAIKAIKENLNDMGFGVIDFMNTDYVIENLVPNEEKEVEGILFKIKRFLKDGFIHKEIKFTDKGQDFSFVEKVKAISLSDFENYFKQANITLLDIFGDYKLNKFHKSTSKRLILIFK